MSGYVYILTNKPQGVLYLGVTSHIEQRVWVHRANINDGFSHKYKTYRLVYVEEYPTITEAIQREKYIKKWRRAWKVKLIEQQNPTWRSLLPIEVEESNERFPPARE
jgi:putative endonuclease